MVLGLIATACLLVAGFCGIRWSLIDVSGTTEQHIANYREQYKGLTAAELIREYEQMEKYGLDLAAPLTNTRSRKGPKGDGARMLASPLLWGGWRFWEPLLCQR